MAVPDQFQLTSDGGEAKWPPQQHTLGVKVEHPHDESEDTVESPPPSHLQAMLKKESDNLMCDDTNMYYGRLTYRDQSLLIHELCTVIGRNSSKSMVDFHVSKNNFISRKHMLIRFHPDTDSFHLECLSKNGVFVDGLFQRSNMEPLELPKKLVKDKIDSALVTAIEKVVAFSQKYFCSFQLHAAIPQYDDSHPV